MAGSTLLKNDIAFGYSHPEIEFSSCEQQQESHESEPVNMRTHDTGAKRSRDADGFRYDLISPFFMRSVAKVLAEGAPKYGEHNWRKGFKFSDVINHLMQHVEKYRAGDTSEDHLGHAACNLMFLMEFTETHPELDDRYKVENGV